MLNVRRLYILAAAFIGLLLFMNGSSELLRLVFLIFSADSEFGLGTDWWREHLSLNLAVVVVGTPLWLGHWVWAQRLARETAEEASALRSLYFLGVLGVTLIETAGAAGETLYVPLARLAGSAFDLNVLFDNLAELIIFGLFWVYHLRQRPPVALQIGWSATIARWYWYAAAFGSLGIVANSVVPLLTTMIQQVLGVESVSASWWQLPVANNIAWIIVGSVGWTYHWANVQAQSADAQSPQLQSALRKVYLYAMVGLGAAGTLLAVGRILYWALLSALNAVEEQLAFIDDVAWVVPTALVAATVWYYHRAQLERDADLVSELPQQAAIRRVYSYLLTAIGISVLSFGTFGILRLVIGILTGQADAADIPEHWLERQLSLYVTLLLVGLIAWVWYWRQTQRRVEADVSGAERASLVRRIYLYLVSSASVIAIVIAIGTLLYQALRAILGILTGDTLVDALNIHLSVALIAVTLLAYHVRFLRGDHRPSEDHEPEGMQDERPAAAVGTVPAEASEHSLVVTLTGGNLANARALIEQSALPDGTRLSILESTLSEDEIRQRLQAESDAEG